MISIQTNIASLESQSAITANTNFLNNTIEQLSTGYRINSSADDAAGLAVANTYTADTTELTQGVLNANNSVSSLQIVDGGANNISQILDRLDTLATESASSYFAGDRNTLNNEYQGLLSEINQQAANVNLNTGGTYNTNLTTYVGGANNSADAQVTVNLSGASNAIDSTALGIQSTNIAGGGTELTGNNVNLNNTAVNFLSGNNAGTQSFTFNLDTGSGAGAQTVTIPVDGTLAGLTGNQVVTALNTSLAQYGISASIANDGQLAFSGSTAFTVTTGALAGGAANAIATPTSTAVNTSNYTLDSSTGTGGAFAAFSAGAGTSASETVAFQTGAGTTNVTLDDTNAGTIGAAIGYLNTQLAGTGIYAIADTNAVNPSISFQSANSFNVNETAYTAAANGGTGNLFGAVGPIAVTAPAAGSSSTGNAISALAALQTAVTNLANANFAGLLSTLGTSTSGGGMEAATTLLNGLEDPTTGAIKQEETSVANEIANQNTQISDAQTQLTQLETNMTNQIAQADSTLASLESQVTFVTGLFAQYTDSSNSSTNGLQTL